MTRKKTALIIVCSVLCLGLFVGIISLFSGGWRSRSIFGHTTYDFFPSGYNYDYSYDGDIKTFTIGGGKLDEDGVSDIEIDWGAGKTKIEKSTDNYIHFKESAKFSMSENQQMRYKLDGSTLKIIYAKPGRHVFSKNSESFGKELTVYLPEKIFNLSYDASSADMEISPNLAFGKVEYDVSSANFTASNIIADELSYSASSGDCEIGGQINKMQLDSSSGTVTINNISGDTLECDTSSGNCEVSGTFRSVNLSTSSGKVSSGGLNADVFSCQTTSGGWNIKGNFKTIEGDASSGAVNMVLSKCPTSANLSTTSGTITMSFPENDGFTARYDTSSGNFSSSFTGTTANNTFLYGNGNSKLDFSTSSGNINLNKN